MRVTIAASPSRIYVASAESGTGKSTIALGLLHLLAASAARVGVFRPIVRSTDEADQLLELMLEHATATLDGHAQCVGVTFEQVHEDPDAALSEIVVRYHEVARRCDAVVIVGSDYTDVIDPSVLTFNARIAVNLGAPVLLAVNGHERSPETITHIAQRCLNEVSAAHARCAAIIANRCDPEYLEGVAEPARLRKGRGQPQRTRLGQRAGEHSREVRPGPHRLLHQGGSRRAEVILMTSVAGTTTAKATGRRQGRGHMTSLGVAIVAYKAS